MAKFKGGRLKSETISRVEQLEKRKAEIEQQIKALKAKEKNTVKKKEAQRKMIVGAAAIAHAAKDEHFYGILQGVLKKNVIDQRHLALIADLIEAPSSEDNMVEVKKMDPV
ncbi:MAG: hypothetical protein ACR65R_07255 [Methylomicrobium sp.]